MITVFLQTIAGGTEIDNGLIGVPDIKCNTDTIEMKFKTKKKFAGKIYVQGHYNNPECRVDYGQASVEGHPIGGIKLSHGACDMDRQRMAMIFSILNLMKIFQIQPEGMQFSTVIVISFHPLFVTKIDRAFHINCLYRETVQTLHQQLEVSALPTEQVQNDMPMPICKYTIRKDEIDGPVLRYARVGDQVVHRWECDSDMYGLLVHSCYVEDGQGEKRLVIDEKGCHTDKLILRDPTYSKDLNLAYRESYVFKFADRVGVRFLCEIRLCVKESGGCNGITPPTCPDNAGVAGDWAASRNSSAVHMKKISKRSPKSPSQVIDADLISQYVYVLDQDGEAQEAALVSDPQGRFSTLVEKNLNKIKITEYGLEQIPNFSGLLGLLKLILQLHFQSSSEVD
ncbi:hypothetical protein FO519_009094 [Halicephalobus sp. NKZ332]|nr:hypothetical protein FO519_009094 [Halicephalobus sp. NKZ332]